MAENQQSQSIHPIMSFEVNIYAGDEAYAEDSFAADDLWDAISERVHSITDGAMSAMSDALLPLGFIVTYRDEGSERVIIPSLPMEADA